VLIPADSARPPRRSSPLRQPHCSPRAWRPLWTGSPSGLADVGGLARHIRPDALVVDCDDEAAELTAVADEFSLLLVHVSLQTRQLRVFRDQNWSASPSWGISPNGIRNVLLGEIYGASVRRRERLGERDPQ
jgi:hypothetical protein